MTLDRRAALVQTGIDAQVGDGQLTHIYRAEQEQTEAQAAAIEAGDPGGDIFIRRPIYELAAALQLLRGCVENMESAIEYGIPK